MLIECLLLYLLCIDIVNEGEELPEGVACQTLPACNLYQFRCYINRSVRAITITNDKSCGIGRVEITARISGGSTEGERNPQLTITKMDENKLEPIKDVNFDEIGRAHV